MFQHYIMRYMYDNGDYRNVVTNEEKLYCFDMAKKWDIIAKYYRNKIIKINLS